MQQANASTRGAYLMYSSSNALQSPCIEAPAKSIHPIFLSIGRTVEMAKHCQRQNNNNSQVMKINRKKRIGRQTNSSFAKNRGRKIPPHPNGFNAPPNAGNDPLPLDRTFRLHRTASNAGSGPPATAIAARRDPERRLRRRMQDAARPAGSAGILPYKFRSAVQNRQTAYPRPGRSSSGKAPL